jgi:hypothetical protein
VFYSKRCPGSNPEARSTPSRRAARSQRLPDAVLAGGGAVSARKRSSAVEIAAASSGEASAPLISIWGRGGRRCPSRAICL